MASLISLLPEPAAASERAANILAATSAVLSGFALLLAVAVAF